MAESMQLLAELCSVYRNFMTHMKATGGYVKRSMPRNFKNRGPKSMGTTIEIPYDREEEPKSRSTILPNKSKNEGYASQGRNQGPIAGLKSRERAEDAGKI